MSVLKSAVVAALSSCLALCRVTSGQANTVTVAPSGVYAQIDTRLANETILTLSKGTPQEKEIAIEGIQAHPENYAPPVFYVLASVLFQPGKKDDAAFWFYAGQLRARVDANRCADVTARSAVGELNKMSGPAINPYIFQDIPKLEQLIPKVVAWDRSTPHTYDNRWINLHGMNAMMSGWGNKDASSSTPALSLPKEQWNAIAEKTRADYLKGFNQALTELKSRKQ